MHTMRCSIQTWFKLLWGRIRRHRSVAGERNLLRGDDDRLERSAVIKGSVRYHHQGGGQDHTHQIIVNYQNTVERDMSKILQQEHIGTLATISQLKTYFYNLTYTHT